jgi:drug/metabolite transporter (DMT)-like permease
MKFSLKQKAIGAMCAVALAYSLLNVVIRLMNEGFEPFSQVYLRIGLGFILTLGIFYKNIHFSKFKKISRRDWFFLFLMGTVGYGFAVDFATLGVLHTTLLNVAVVSCTTPLFVFLFAVLFMRKKIDRKLLIFLLVTFYGICVLATNSFVPILSHFAIGDLYVLFSAMGFGVYILARKALSKQLNNSEIAVVAMFFAFISSLLVALFSGESLHIAGFLNPFAFTGLVLGGILNLAATKLENFAFNHLNAVVGAQLYLLENVFSPIFGFILYQEIILPLEFVGALIVIAGVWAYIREEKE